MTIENWMLLTINSNKELVTRGTDISKKFYKTFKEAHTDMLYSSRCYAKAKELIFLYDKVFFSYNIPVRRDKNESSFK